MQCSVVQCGVWSDEGRSSRPRAFLRHDDQPETLKRVVSLVELADCRAGVGSVW